ncbi:hypothetical protein [Leucobacter sp. GX24907]
MVAALIDEDPELAHQHAISASRRAGRIPVTRETLAITAYRTGDFALALRELRTYRRLTGSADHLALMVDCERGLDRPEKAIQTGLDADTKHLDTEQRVQLAIAMSGARLDLNQTQQALYELEIPELNPDRAYSWSPDLFRAYAAVLQDLGREAEAGSWDARADEAERALQQHYGVHDELEVFEVFEEHEPEAASEQAAASGDAEAGIAEADAAEADAAEAGSADARATEADLTEVDPADAMAVTDADLAEVDALLADSADDAAEQPDAGSNKEN